MTIHRSRFYLAAPFVEREAARAARTILVNAGYSCTSRWIDKHLEQNDDGIKPEQAAWEAKQDLRDIQAAQILVLLNDYPKSNGRAIEFGYALGEGMPIYLIGKRSSVFHYLPAVRQFNTIEEMIDAAE